MDPYTFMATVSRMDHYEQIAREMARRPQPERSKDRKSKKDRPESAGRDTLLVPAARNV